ncbi:hypothetical protein FIBSPDRAFT_706590, partial [Athelia psychrophila]
ATINADFILGECYNIVATLSVKGYIVTYVVPSSVDGNEFFNFIVQEVLPSMKPYLQERSILILDNGVICKNGALHEGAEA